MTIMKQRTLLMGESVLLVAFGCGEVFGKLGGMGMAGGRTSFC